MKTSNTSFTNKLVVPALLLIFAGPMLVSWWMLNYTDYKVKDNGASHGQLIVPPRPLADAALLNLQEEDSGETLHGKWSLVYLHRGICEKDCIDTLYKMRQMRLATGKYAPRIQRILLLEQETGAFYASDTDLLKYFPGQLILPVDENDQFSSLHAFSVSGEVDPPSGWLYLVDPLGNLMLRWAPDAEPHGIIKDLKRLLRYSRIG